MAAPFFLVGPTAVGKTGLALEVAEQCGAEIVNGDAFQIYRGLDLLSAKPEAEAQRRVRHHLLSVVELTETMSAVKFREMALLALAEIGGRKKNALVVSGSGLYTRALTHGFDHLASPDLKLRRQLENIPLAGLVHRLQVTNPEIAAGTDLRNRRRVVRAMEIAEAGAQNRSAVAAPAVQRTPRGVLLLRDREDLYARINGRVDAIFRAGVEQEVAALTEIGPTASQALGLREIQHLIAGKISRAECIARIQQKTRRYAKRQLTWFRRQTNFPQLNLTALSHSQAVSALTQAMAAE